MVNQPLSPRKWKEREFHSKAIYTNAKRKKLHSKGREEEELLAALRHLELRRRRGDEANPLLTKFSWHNIRVVGGEEGDEGFLGLSAMCSCFEILPRSHLRWDMHDVADENWEERSILRWCQDLISPILRS